MILGLDHFVLTVRDIDASCDFYSRALDAKIVEFNDGRKAIQLGGQKINLHQVGVEIEPKATRPTPGSGDFCVLVYVPIDEVVTRLKVEGIKIEEGPVRRTGATGSLLSIYVRDPDGNLVEISNRTE